MNSPKLFGKLRGRGSKRVPSQTAAAEAGTMARTIKGMKRAWRKIIKMHITPSLLQ